MCFNGFYFAEFDCGEKNFFDKKKILYKILVCSSDHAAKDLITKKERQNLVCWASIESCQASRCSQQQNSMNFNPNF
jgi:hypothetical protein